MFNVFVIKNNRNVRLKTVATVQEGRDYLSTIDTIVYEDTEYHAVKGDCYDLAGKFDTYAIEPV